MANGRIGGDGLPVSRRTVLKGMGGIGAGAVVGAYEPGSASGDHLSVSEAELPADMVREYWYDPRTEYCPVIVSRGVQQTNLAVVDDDGYWRDDCGDGPGIRHRFTAAGVFQGVDEATLHVSVDGDWCGRTSLSPFYTWSGAVDERVASDDLQRPSNFAELESAVRDRHGDVDSPENPVNLDAFLTAANVAVGGLGLVTGGLPLAVASAALTVGEFVSMLSDPETNVMQRDDHEIDIERREMTADSTRYLWADFSVVVPAGEAVSFDIEWGVATGAAPTNPEGPADARNVPDFDDFSHRVEIPAIEVGDDVGAVDTPTITTSGGPIERTVDDDGSVTVEATPDAGALGTPNWELRQADGDLDTGSGRSHSRQYDEEGVYPASFRAADEAVDGFEYMATAPLQVGDDPFQPDGHPTVTLDVPATADPGQTLSLTATASTPNGGVARHDWTVYKSVQGRGRVTYATRGGDGAPDPLEETFTCGGYTVELTVRDDADQTATATQTLTVAGPDPEPTIEAPDGVAPGETIELSFTTADGVTVANQSWSGAIDEGGPSPTVSFEETGEKEIDLFVTTACANGGEATHTIGVANCDPPTVSVTGPEEADPGETVTFSASASGADEPCSVARYEWSILKSVQGRGLVEVERDAAEGVPSDYDTELDCGGHEVRLTVWNGVEQSATARHTVAVTGPPPAPTIQAPDAVRVGESFELSVTLGNDVGVDLASWSGDVNSSAYSPTVSFDSPGEKTVELTVYTACNNFGSTTTTVTAEACDAPVVSLDGPGQADPGESLTFDGQAGGCSIASHEWCLYRSVQGRGPVEVTCESGSGPPGSFEISPNCGGHTVELSVTDASGQTATGQTTLSVSGPPPEPTIQGPDTARVGESFELSLTLGNDVGVDLASWSGDVNSSAYSPTVSFDSPGEKTVELTVYTACNNFGSTTMTVTVEACGPPSSVSLDAPSMVDPDDQVTVSASVSADCPDELTYEWIQRHQPFCGSMSDVATESGSGSPGSYTFTADGGYSEVELSVSGAGETVSETIRLTAGQTSSGCYY